MSLRTKFGDEGCRRFGDDGADPANTPSGDTSGKKSTSALDKKLGRIAADGMAEIEAIVADLQRENKALRQQVAELTLKLAGTKNKTGVTKIGVTDNENDATKNQTRKRGPKPKLTPEQKRGKTAARVAAWRAKNPSSS